MAVSSPVATSRVKVAFRAVTADSTRVPVASADVSLMNVRSQVVLADVMIDHQPGPRECSDEIRHVAELAPGREIENQRHLAIGQLVGMDRLAEMFEQRTLGIKKVVSGRCGTDVDHTHVLALLPEQSRHADLGTECVAIGANVRRHQESVVDLDEVSQRCPVDVHADSGSRSRKSRPA